MRRFCFTCLLTLFVVLPSLAEEKKQPINISWNELTEMPENGSLYKTFSFKGARYDAVEKGLPYLVQLIEIPDGVNQLELSLKNVEAKEISAEERIVINRISNLDLTPDYTIVTIKKRKYAEIKVYPFVKTRNGLVKKINNFDLSLVYETAFLAKKRVADFTNNSILSTGKWYKIAVIEDGVHRITPEMLSDKGIDVTSINPGNIRIYGNGGGMLPERNDVERLDDIQENAIIVNGGSDGSFDSGDEILFYGQSPHRWTYNDNTNRYEHIQNLYRDTTYYFLNTDLGPGKRISDLTPASGTTNVTSSSYDSYWFHESETENIVNSGRQWFGEKFDVVDNYNFNAEFNNRISSAPIYIKARAVGRSSAATSIEIKHNNSEVLEFSIGTFVNGDTKVDDGEGDAEFNSSDSNIDLRVSYIHTLNPSAFAYLDYIELQSRSTIRLSDGQTIFRDYTTVGAGNITEFSISSWNTGQIVWDVSDPINTRNVLVNGSNGSFKTATDVLKEYVIFDGSSYLEPEILPNLVPNQNLHGLAQADYIVVSHPKFLSEANRLANFHKEQSNMSSVVVTTDQIYNEFGSGGQDLTAIKDFVRMFYERSTSEADMPKNLLLFGDASFDYKHRVVDNSNYVPTFESYSSFNIKGSFSTDDYFVLLDPEEGASGAIKSEQVDMGVGRFIVRTEDEARAVVDKVIAYVQSSSLGDWRNRIVFVADDVDDDWERALSIHADGVSDIVKENYKSANIDKIYADAYVQESSSGGARYPEVQRAITDRVNRGSLIIHYYGHGGELGWGTERFLENEDIISWDNINNMPVFVTATCEFSRYDDAERISAGEYVQLNEKGGGIALFTTTRTISEPSARGLSSEFYNHALNKEYTMGEVLQKMKNSLSSGSEKRNFILLGDPALKMAYPKYDIVATTINDQPLEAFTDTLKALSLVTISGEVRNGANLMEDFSGLLFPSIFDKVVERTTLNNDNAKYSDGEPVPPVEFDLQKNIVYRGKVAVENGRFTFSFIVPKDIQLRVDDGRFSFYAHNNTIDASGYYNEVKIGDINGDAADDSDGPDLQLYMNDESFVFGGLTDESPNLLAIISDQSGINTVGSGIGHDLVAVLDDKNEDVVVLNDYYEADLNSYQQGRILYPFADLTEGLHTLKVKVWDVYNNSRESHTEFVVAASAGLALKHVLNYPNPFTSFTDFHFEHNRANDVLDVQVQIFTVSGRLVKTINTQVQTDSSFRESSIRWDGNDDFGDNIGKGVYVYRLKVRAGSDQSTAEEIEKLVILK